MILTVYKKILLQSSLSELCDSCTCRLISWSDTYAVWLCGTPGAGPKCLYASRALRGPVMRNKNMSDTRSLGIVILKWLTTGHFYISPAEQ